MNGTYNFDEIMKPFWCSDTIYNESVLMLSENVEPASAPLLFHNPKILSVRNSYLDTEYTEGEDWIYKDGLLQLTDKSKAAFMTMEELYPPQAREGWTFPKIGGGNILFQEKHFFHDRQLSVTYMHPVDKWEGPVPEFAGEKLCRTLSKLEKKQPLKIILYGDSISAGSNASGKTGAPPYQPIWGSLFARRLERAFNTEVEFLNPSVGGTVSKWGAENAEELVSRHMPDLVVLAFGMNDGTGRVTPGEFKNNISLIMENVRSYNSDAEFILVAPMLPNTLAAIPGQPNIGFFGEQENYRESLDRLAGTDTVVADMTAIHRELLKHKRYCDMTGNNVNHPNDFLVRWYAQVVSALLVKE